MSKHSLERFQQRGFKKDFFMIISIYGERLFRNGAYWIFISKETIKNLMHSKSLSREFKLFLKQNSEKIRKKVLVESLDGTIITVMNFKGRLNYE